MNDPNIPGALVLDQTVQTEQTMQSLIRYCGLRTMSYM